MPLLLLLPLAGIVGFGGGWFVADGTKGLIKIILIGGTAYFLLATPSGKSVLKKVIK